MKLFSFTVRWDQDVREWLAQDESRVVGKRRVEGVYNVVATNFVQARDAVLVRLKHQNPEIEGQPIQIPIHLHVKHEVKVYEEIAEVRVLEPR